MASSKCFVSGTATATNRFNTDNELTKPKALRAAIPDDLHEAVLAHTECEHISMDALISRALSSELGGELGCERRIPKCDSVSRRNKTLAS